MATKPFVADPDNPLKLRDNYVGQGGWASPTQTSWLNSLGAEIPTVVVGKLTYRQASDWITELKESRNLPVGRHRVDMSKEPAGGWYTIPAPPPAAGLDTPVNKLTDSPPSSPPPAAARHPGEQAHRFATLIPASRRRARHPGEQAHRLTIEGDPHEYTTGEPSRANAERTTPRREISCQRPHTGLSPTRGESHRRRTREVISVVKRDILHGGHGRRTRTLPDDVQGVQPASPHEAHLCLPSQFRQDGDGTDH